MNLGIPETQLSEWLEHKARVHLVPDSDLDWASLSPVQVWFRTGQVRFVPSLVWVQIKASRMLDAGASWVRFGSHASITGVDKLVVMHVMGAE